MYGALPLPMTLEYEWFSMMTTTVWSGRGMVARAAGRLTSAPGPARSPARKVSTQTARIPITLSVRNHSSAMKIPVDARDRL
jgi:hypothetical protein